MCFNSSRAIFGKVTANVLRLALSGVAPTPSHYKYNKTFHSAADFPQENPEVAIEANRCCMLCLFKFIQFNCFLKVIFKFFRQRLVCKLYDCIRTIKSNYFYFRIVNLKISIFPNQIISLNER